MIIFPAVDIQKGKAVRLKQGRKDDATVYGEDPLEMARCWREQGAEWLHVIDLDAAFNGKSDNAFIIGQISRELGLPVQAGGGIRDVETAARYLDAGVTRLITGTVALEDEKTFAQMCAEFPGRIGVSLDARNGILQSRGWVKDAGKKAADVLPRLEDAGAAFIIYTDIERDGMESGLNFEALGKLLKISSLPIIAAGGVANLEDVRKAYEAFGNHPGFEGIVSGRAIYEKSLDLAEAIAWLKNRPAS